MEMQLMRTTAGSMLCLRDDCGTIIGWIPFPRAADAIGPGRGTVFLARPTQATAASLSVTAESRAA